MITIHTLYNAIWVRQHRDHQPVVEAAAGGRWKCGKEKKRKVICILLCVSSTGFVRKRIVDRWQRSTASTRTWKRSSVFWRLCSVNKTQPRQVELLTVGILIHLTGLLSFSFFFSKKELLKPSCLYSCHAHGVNALYMKNINENSLQSNLRFWAKK